MVGSNSKLFPVGADVSGVPTTGPTAPPVTPMMDAVFVYVYIILILTIIHPSIAGGNI